MLPRFVLLCTRVCSVTDQRTLGRKRLEMHFSASDGNVGNLPGLACSAGPGAASRDITARASHQCRGLKASAVAELP